jgi:hypothetical protein
MTAILLQRDSHVTMAHPRRIAAATWRKIAATPPLSGR